MNAPLQKSAEEYFNHYGHQILYVCRVGLLQKRREEVSFIVFSMSVQMHLLRLRCGGGEEGIPISNPNLHPSVASVRKDIPIFLLNSIQKDLNTHKKLVVFLLHFRINIFCKAFFA